MGGTNIHKENAGGKRNDLIVLDWGGCHSKKLRISGTEDMEKEYKDYMFHVRGACIGIVLGLIVALLSGCIIHFCFVV